MVWMLCRKSGQGKCSIGNYSTTKAYRERDGRGVKAKGKGRIKTTGKLKYKGKTCDSKRTKGKGIS